MPTLTRIASEHLSVEVSSLGAEMQSLTGKGGQSWLWNGDAAFWSGRSPVLFPMVGRAPADTISIDGTAYKMGQHGFARRSEFSLTASTESMCRYELASSAESMAVYPFDFRLALEHRLDGNRLTVSTEVSNCGTAAMPFGLGYHSAFVWPVPGAAPEQPHVVLLDNGGEPPLIRLDGGLVKPEPLPSPFKKGRLVLDHAMFEADAMLFPVGAGNGLRYGVEGGPMMHFHFDNLPNLALWTKPGAPFICIEPWHGTAAEVGGSDDLRKRPFGNLLPANESLRFAFTVDVPV